MNTTTVVSDRLWHDANSWNAERVVRLSNGTKLRATVRRDFYDRFSVARADAFTQNGWTHVLSRHISEVPAKAVLSGMRQDVHGEKIQEAMDATLIGLLDAAAEIVR
jgi:hypothetical protein